VRRIPIRIEKMLEIPKAVAVQIPSYDGKSADDTSGEILWVRFVEPQNQSEWYVARFDGTDLCFGLKRVINFANAFGEFRLSELSALTNDFGGGVQLDESYEPKPSLQVLAEISGHPKWADRENR
jgi:Protein of unknown function (DUF2958)